MSDIVCVADLDDKESVVRAAVNSLLQSLHSYKLELSQQEKKLQEARSLKLDQLTDSNAVDTINNLRRKFEQKDADLILCQQKLDEVNETVSKQNSDVQAKSRHIERLSSLLLSKEERIQTLEESVKEKERKIRSLEVLVEARSNDCEKWKSAAQQAALRMREQLTTLKASEDMNQDLRNLLDKQMNKLSSQDPEGERTPRLSPAVDALITDGLTCHVIKSRGTHSPLTVVRASSPRLASITAVPSPSSMGTWSDGAVTSPTMTSHYRTNVQDDVSPATSKTVTSHAGDVSSKRETSYKKLYLTSQTSPRVEIPTTDDSPGTARVRFNVDDDVTMPTASPAPVPEGQGHGATLAYPTPVPVHSTMVADALESGRIHDPVLWRYFIRECVHFYYDLIPTTDAAARNSYFNIGRTLYETYPCIAKEGPNFKTPWTYFNTCLSSRLRNERFTKKRQGEKRTHIVPVTESDCTEASRFRPVNEPDVTEQLRFRPVREPVSARLTPDRNLNEDQDSKRARYDAVTESPGDSDSRGCRL